MTTLETPNNLSISHEMKANQVTNSGVLVRPMIQEDAPAVARIWEEGLPQTADSAFVLFRSTIRGHMEQYAQEALAPDGDVGPEGCNLLSNWSGDDRVMLVACLEEDPENVVGCVAVKIGSDYQKPQPESKEASIWRMSVDTSVQRRGLGKALMEHAQEWAIKKNCVSMRLVTANLIAAKFYCDKMGFQLEPEENRSWMEELKSFGRPRPLWYRKPLA